MTLDVREIEEVCAVYGHLGSLKAVSRELGYSPNTVKKYVIQNGFEVAGQNIIRCLKSTDEHLIGTYVGLWMGDGTQHVDRGSYVTKICCNKKCRKMNEFIVKVMNELFGVKARIHEESNTNCAEVKVFSKFIFNFIYFHVNRGYNKTHTVQLKEKTSFYSQTFLEGCILGLMLSDGSLFEQLRFGVTSIGLAENMGDLLVHFGFHPKIYVQYGRENHYKDVYTVWLSRPESRKVNLLLNQILISMGCRTPFKRMKSGPDVI